MTNIETFKGSNAVETLGITGGAGVSISTANGSGLKGAYVTIGTPTFAYDGIILSVMGFGGVIRVCEIDLAIGSTPDIIVASAVYVFPQNSAGGALQLPIKVPAGVALKARIATQSGSTATTQISAVGYQQNSWNRGFSYAEQLNTLSAGVPITNLALPGNTSQTAWTQLIAATANDYGALGIEGPYVTGTSVGTTQVAMDFGIGTASSESQIFTHHCLNLISNGGLPCVDRVVVPCAIPKGSRLSFRLQAAAGTSVNVFNPLVIGFVP